MHALQGSEALAAYSALVPRLCNILLNLFSDMLGLAFWPSSLESAQNAPLFLGMHPGMPACPDSIKVIFHIPFKVAIAGIEPTA